MTDGIDAIAVEGKVAESFDKTLAEWDAENSRGKAKRLKFIKKQLASAMSCRQQFAINCSIAQHRIIEAQRFNARVPWWLCIRFQRDQWFDAYRAFAEIFAVQETAVGRLQVLTEANGRRVYTGWARGEERFLRM
jgi:hypothetical protein